MPERNAVERVAELRRFLTFRLGEQLYALPADSAVEIIEVPAVLRVPRQALAPAPGLSSDMERLVRGVLNLTAVNRMVLVLDPAELLTPAERGRLDAFQKAARDSA